MMGTLMILLMRQGIFLIMVMGRMVGSEGLDSRAHVSARFFFLLGFRSVARLVLGFLVCSFAQSTLISPHLSDFGAQALLALAPWAYITLTLRGTPLSGTAYPPAHRDCKHGELIV